MANKLAAGIWMNGRSWPVWHYRELPEGVRPAVPADLQRYGTPVLYQVRIGPDAGDYYADFVRTSTRSVLLRMLQEGVPLYVKE